MPLFAEQKLDYDSCPDLTTLAELAQTEDTYDPTLVDWRSVKVGAHCHVNFAALANASSTGLSMSCRVSCRAYAGLN